MRRIKSYKHNQLKMFFARKMQKICSTSFKNFCRYRLARIVEPNNCQCNLSERNFK